MTGITLRKIISRYWRAPRSPAYPQKHGCKENRDGLLRTASGAFIKADSIVALSPRRDGDGQITWAAVRADGSQVELAGYYGTPGRIEKTLPHLISAPAAPAHAI